MGLLFRYQLSVLTVIMLSQLAGAQQAKSEPFVQYTGQEAEYLKRLHSRDGALAWSQAFDGGFTAWQTAARAKLVELLGLDRIAADAARHRPAVKLEPPIPEDGYVRQLGRIETEPGIVVPFWLLTPNNRPAEKRPLVICAHGHNTNGWNSYAGVYDDSQHRQATLAKEGDPGVQAVKRGYVALVPATRGLAQSNLVSDPKGRHGKRACRAQLIHCLLAGRTAVGERVWDTQRILDWALTELPNVDRDRVVMLGNSGGGVLTVYVAALDERVAVAVPSCSFTSFTSSTGFVFHCDCCLVPRIQVEIGDMPDIGALAAPRPLLAVHGRKDSLHSSNDVESAMERVQEIYHEVGAANRFRFVWGDEGHKFYPDLMWPFIRKHLPPEPSTN